MKSGINKLTFSFIVFLLGITYVHNFAHGQSQASTTAAAIAVVVPSIGLSKTQDLSFGSSAPGDGPKVLSPSGCSDCAKFNVTGGPNAAYSIQLPADGTVSLSNGAGNSIGVSQFRSLPAAEGTLSNAGAQTLTVGATRGTVAPGSAVGVYTGSFTVTVCYQ